MAEITSLTENWNGHSGSEVQAFIKSQLQNAISASGGKVGFVEYDGSSIKFYTEEGGELISTITLAGTVYAVSLASETDSSFYVLTSDESAYIRLTPTSKSGTLGGDMTDFVEDYTYTVGVDNGTGTFTEKRTGTCLSGGTIEENVRQYLVTGSNRVRISVTGQESGQQKSMVYTVTVTTLALTVNYSWNKPFIEGNSYSIDNIYFSGNMAKVLHVRVDDDDAQTYTVNFPSGTNYTTSAYSFDMSQHFPTSGTGTHTLEVWMTGNGVETAHYKYQWMAVATSDVNKKPLVAINEVLSPAVNYDTQILFKYAVYNATSLGVKIVATDGTTDTSSTRSDGLAEYAVADETLTVTPEIKNSYATKLEIDTEELDNVKLELTVSLDSETAYEATVPVDNSKSFAPVEGAVFYMNPARRSNATSDKETILNIAPKATTTEYAATWTGFSWSGDGWADDGDGNKCLAVPAGSTVEVAKLTPLTTAATLSKTIEWKYKVANCANYDDPVMTMSDVTSDGRTVGLKLYPTKLELLTSNEQDTVTQTLQLNEDEMLHVALVLQRDYQNSGHNLAQVYVNGMPQLNFEYGGTSSFGDGVVKLGQDATDLYLYMMRVYDTAFDSSQVLTNFLNTITDGVDFTREGVRKDNAIMDAGEISYSMAKQAGFNCMVIEIDNDADIPSLNNTAGRNSTLTVEYNDHPEWNFTIENAPVGGQGTTSMKYYRWNLRWKLASSSVWTYADGTTSKKKGWMDGNGNHPQVNKITAKKNVASSTQGHKMGATAMYTELYEQCGINKVPTGSELPDGARVSVYEYPMMGFQKKSDGTYSFIGLYTIGPDKGDKGTFGYDTANYPYLLSLEGPNHSPLGTRFLVPWDANTKYIAEDSVTGIEEDLAFGGVQEGWDVDVYDDDNLSTDQLQTLLEQEWKPAYDIAYYCSPWICSLAETGYSTLADLNANATTFRNKSDILTNRKNECLTLYDSDYSLIYWDLATSAYIYLQDVSVTEYKDNTATTTAYTGKFNIVTYLGSYLSTTTPTTAEIRAARLAKFKAEAANYWSMADAEYHDNFLMLVGGSDNHAKNSYPFKLQRLQDGGRWKWRQDDLDTILPTDNNGMSTKDYFVEVGDLTSAGVDVFQGSSSAFWTLVRTGFESELKAMMKTMVDGLVALSQKYNCSGSYTWQSVYNMMDYYFWEHSADYFPMMAYCQDRDYTYLTPWKLDPTKQYNNVYPLTQALGTQKEAEERWVLRRIIYVFSLYQIGAFTGSDGDGCGTLEFTPAEAFDFELTPAIELYPSGNLGGGTNVKGGRTEAGKTCTIAATSTGDTTFYIKALDWLTSLGDLSGLKLTSRSSAAATLAVSAKRLRELKVGDETADNVKFNAASLSVSGAALETIDARNVASLISAVDLSQCPRLRTALFEGSNATMLTLPAGSKVSKVSMPSAVTTLFLYNLPMLTDAGLTVPEAAKKTIQTLYVSGVSGVDAWNLLESIYNTSGNSLKFVNMKWDGTKVGTQATLDMLGTFCANAYDETTGTGYGSVELSQSESTGLYSLKNSSAAPSFTGSVLINDIGFTDSINAITSYVNGKLDLQVKYVVPRVDSNVYYRFPAQSEIVAKYTDGYWSYDGVWKTVTTTVEKAFLLEIGDHQKFWFNSNNYNSWQVAFLCNGIGDDHTITDMNRVLTQEIDCTGYKYLLITTTGDGASRYVNLKYVYDNISSRYGSYYWMDTLTDSEARERVAEDDANLESIVDTWESGVAPTVNESAEAEGNPAGRCATLRYLPYVDTYDTNVNCSWDWAINAVSAIVPKCKKYQYTFYGCRNLVKVEGDWPDGITDIGQSFFDCYSLKSTTLPKSLTSIKVYSFNNCQNLETLDLPDSITLIDGEAFYRCSSLNLSKLPDNLKTIGRHSFAYCTNLALTSLPSGLTEIGGSAFTGCKNLALTSLPSGLTVLNDSVFSDCTNMPLASLPSGLTKISSYAFARCTSLKLTSLPDSVTEIGAQAFIYDTELTFTKLPKNLKTIGYYAFGGCTNLALTELPSGLTSIGSFAFNACSNIKMTSLPSGLTKIEMSTFASCTSLALTSLPDGITSIDVSAFSGCIGLKLSSLPSSLTTIGGSAFRGCTGITISEIPEGVTEIGQTAFNGCSSMTELTVPSTLISIGQQCIPANVKTFTCNATTPPTLGAMNWQNWNSTNHPTIYVPDASVSAYKSATNWSAFANYILPLSEKA